MGDQSASRSAAVSNEGPEVSLGIPAERNLRMGMFLLLWLAPPIALWAVFVLGLVPVDTYQLVVGAVGGGLVTLMGWRFSFLLVGKIFPSKVVFQASGIEVRRPLRRVARIPYAEIVDVMDGKSTYGTIDVEGVEVSREEVPVILFRLRSGEELVVYAFDAMARRSVIERLHLSR